ncbi:MAG: DUF4143 domain-containing protein [Parabacteroides sp.]|nr:DUF4143 domain-containing protein [bacterium]MDY4102478.1 DUF4143 domain-containing protein [Parabacteroides sp.]
MKYSHAPRPSVRSNTIDASVYLDTSPSFSEFKGALAENYILQSLTANGLNCMRYWSSGNRAEVDFLMQYGNRVIPIEVKSDTNINGRSLIEFDKKYSPSLRLRYSMRNLSKDGNLINIPLFLADRTDLFLGVVYYFIVVHLHKHSTSK